MAQAAPDLLHMAEGCSDECGPIAALLYDLEHKDQWSVGRDPPLYGLTCSNPQSSEPLCPQGSSTGNTWADLTRMRVEQQCLTFVTGHVHNVCECCLAT